MNTIAARSLVPRSVSRTRTHPAATPDSYVPGQRQANPGIYKPVPGLMRGSSAQAPSQRLADQAWQQLAVADSRQGRARAPQIEARYRVLGHPRINRPYPDPALENAGLPQDLPMDVHSKFKWLLSKPLVLGEHRDVVLLPTQFEGGPTWLDDGEYECRDFFIALRRDPESGRYRECGSLMSRKPGFQEVFRSVGPVCAMPDNKNQFMVHLEEGSYTGIYGRSTRLYEVTTDGIQEVGCWDGHHSPQEIRAMPSEQGPDKQALHNPSTQTIESMNYSRNWQSQAVKD